MQHMRMFVTAKMYPVMHPLEDQVPSLIIMHVNFTPRIVYGHTRSTYPHTIVVPHTIVMPTHHCYAHTQCYDHRRLSHKYITDTSQTPQPSHKHLHDKTPMERLKGFSAV